MSEVEKKLQKRKWQILLKMIWGYPLVVLHVSWTELNKKAYMLAVVEHMNTWYD